MEVEFLDFDGKHIDFSGLDGGAFEELCFDLLRRLGFRSMIWIQGGADQGRDIEAEFKPRNPLVEDYKEKWFFECKNHRTGIGVDDLQTKLSWADAERPDHLVILVGSYLTRSCREWLRKLAPKKAYKVHVVEGKALKVLLLGYPDLIECHFADPLHDLLGDAVRQWNQLNVLPGLEQLCLLASHVLPDRLPPEQIAFLWCVSLFKKSEIDECDDDDIDEASFGVFLEELRRHARVRAPVLMQATQVQVFQQIVTGHPTPMVIRNGRFMVPKPAKDRPRYKPLVAAQLWIDRSTRPRPGLYAYLAEGGCSAIEVLVEGGRTLSCAVRRIDGDVERDQEGAISALQNAAYQPLRAGETD